MNGFKFTILFFALAILGSVEAVFGTLSTVTLNNALTVPLLSGTVGTLATPLAVLGVLKLGAAALLALGLLGSGGNEEEEYYEPSSGYSYHRSKRSTVLNGAGSTSADAIFDLVSAMDTYSCGKQLICELQAKPSNSLQDDEKLMLSLFSKSANKKVNVGTAKAEYDLAAQLGKVSKSQVMCRQRYATCPFTGEEMMSALRNSNL